MIGVGATVGTVSAGYTKAPRTPVVVAPQAPAITSQTSAIAPQPPAQDGYPNNRITATRAAGDGADRNVTVVAMTPKAPRPAVEPAAATVIAARFPAQWANQPVRAGNGDNDPPPQVLAYAAESSRPQPARPAMQLASVESTSAPAPAPMPKRVERSAPPKPAVLFNDAQLASIKARLRLTRDQEQYWPQVEQALRAISWRIATQQNPQRPVHGRQQAAMIDPNSAEVSRLKSAAFPLIMSMREDQKQEVRQLAHTMGLSQVASMF